MTRQKAAALFLVLFTFAIASAGQNTSSDTKQLTIGVSDEIKSAELGETRRLNIYLPEGYKQSDPTTYPVIYLLDGGMDEDFIHVVGLVQFDTFPWVDRLPRSIVVGLVNVDRKRDFTFASSLDPEKKRNPTSGHSDKFIAFLKNELQPFVERKYHGGGPDTLIGESLGGLLATEILLKTPQMFDKYVIISPSLWWNDGSILDATLAKLQDKSLKKTAVYLAAGKEGLAPTEKPHVMEVDVNVLADKLKDIKNPNLSVCFDYLPQEDHATISHQALLNAFKVLHTMSGSQ